VKVKISQAYMKCVKTHKKGDKNLTLSLRLRYRAKEDIKHNMIAKNRTYVYVDLCTKILYGHRN